MRRRRALPARMCRCHMRQIWRGSRFQAPSTLSRRRSPFCTEPEGMATKAPMTWKEGGCHCGAVAFEVLVPDEVDVLDCNCSICAMTGYLHLIVPRDSFRLIKGEDMLSRYEFNTMTAKHLFC